MASTGALPNPDMLPHTLYVYLITNDTTTTLIDTFNVLDSTWTSESFTFDYITDSQNTYRLGFIIQQDDNSFSDVAFDDMSYTVNGVTTQIPTVSNDHRWSRVGTSVSTTTLLNIISSGNTIQNGTTAGNVNYSSGTFNTGLSPLSGTFIYFEGSLSHPGPVYIVTESITI